MPRDGWWSKRFLNKLNFKSPFVFLAGKRLVDIKKSYTQEIKKGSEGIIIKKLNSPYLVGKEAPIATHYWRKVK